ncbi:hypothetical protein KFZ56_18015 [Virgibacillus sp. NKC19-3]|uniref:hypothetical protein n=1 Tax=Virgibacillus saliphilus TaxID=2831674 RepID=UPI001C9BA446|nr:hypothetical protein [Virgibacillus sp. NKC19-3]MBY7144915.1 hypothetical protein [Virgibacillus sp. NKC19-3]
MNTKEEVIKLIKELPDNVTMEEIMHELYVRINMEKGVQDLSEGKIEAHKTPKMRSGKWLH